MSTPRLAKLMKSKTVRHVFRDHAFQFVMIKDVDTDTVVFANKVVTDRMGLALGALNETPASANFSAYAEYHEDDVEICKTRPMGRLGYEETIPNKHGGVDRLITNKVPVKFEGTQYVVIVSMNITSLWESHSDLHDRGRVFNLDKLSGAREQMQEYFEELVERDRQKG